MLFTDAPGEWFTRWAEKKNADDAEGARWIISNAHRFVFVVDVHAFASDDVGIARERALSLSRPLAEASRGREVLLTLTKTDAARERQIEDPIVDRLKRQLKPTTTLETSVFSPDILNVLDWCTRPFNYSNHEVEPSAPPNPFWNYK